LSLNMLFIASTTAIKLSAGINTYHALAHSSFNRSQFNHSPVNRHAENASIHFQGVSEALDKPSLSLMLQIYHMFIKYCHQFKPTIMSYSRVSQVTMPFHQVYHIRYEVMPQISQGIPLKAN